MKTYLVGGAVRDQLSGKAPKDKDYLVVESSALDLERLGFIRVGKSYDIFLHPETKEEYVLTTDLFADLRRRDITINSMAMDERGQLIDPFNGKRDLEEKWLRHTSESFSEDPLRLYRLARFCAQWPLFNVHPDTVKFSQEIAKTTSFKKIHVNRIFNEFKTALTSALPGRFFLTLDLLGAKDLHFGQILHWDNIEGVRPEALYRFSYLARWLSEDQIEKFCEDLQAPNIWKIYARATKITHELLMIEQRTPEELMQFFYAIDAFRRTELVLFLRDLFGEKFTAVKEAYFLIRKMDIETSGKSGVQIAEELKSKRIAMLKEKKP